MTEMTSAAAQEGRKTIDNRRKESSMQNIPEFKQDEDDIRYDDILQLQLRRKIKLRSEDMAA